VSPSLDSSLLASAQEATNLVVSILESSTEHAIIGKALDGTIILWNEGARRAYGYEADEVVGKLKASVLHVPEDVQAGEPQWIMDQARQRGKWEGIIRRVRKNGERFTARVVVTPRCDSTGRVVGFLLISRDLSEEIRAEQAVAYFRSLESAPDAMLVVDSAKQRALEAQLLHAQKMEAVGQLAGGVAHEINNMMTIVAGYGEILLRKLPPENAARSAAEQIKRAGDRAAEVARQLLAFSRKQVLQPMVVDLNPVISGVAKMIRAVVGENIELVTRLQPSLWSVRVDPGQMEQVLINLAANARDAMPAGGTLTIATENQSETGEPKSGAQVVLCVSDTGCGMDGHTRAHLFEPFFTTKEIGKGTGLGLATVHGIVAQSSGSISVDSAPGQGSTFRIYLPRCRPLAPARKSAPGTRRIPQARETVLLVEDEANVRSLARLALETAGYTVVEAPNGEEALRAFEEQIVPFRLLVTDVMMPRMNGKQLAERLAAMQPGLKTLFVSGYPTDALSQQGALGEHSDFLQKPYMPSTLVHKVAELLACRPGAPEAAGPGQRKEAAGRHDVDGSGPVADHVEQTR
jgi:PAS domain S-box-containing protein